MSSEERMKRLGLSHLLNEPDHVQLKALLEFRAKQAAREALSKAAASPQSQPKPKSK